MEGVACQETGCRVHDFLPFNCPVCDGTYCLAHRSRFVHSCIHQEVKSESKTENVLKPSVKEVMDAVETRFANDEDMKPSIHKTHLTKSSGDKSSPDDKTSKSIAKLDRISSTTTSETSRRICNKTKQILIANKAIGQSSLISEDRFYISISFLQMPDMATKRPLDSETLLHVFVSKYLTLGNVLENIANKYPNECFGAAVRPGHLSLAVCTEDTPDWRLWDRSELITNVLQSFENVTIFAVPIDEVVQSQRNLNAARAEASDAADAARGVDPQAAEGVASTATSAAASSAEISSPEPAAKPLSVGQAVVYRNSEGVEEAVVIIGVHFDDFPNVYYTIRFDGSTRERQTDGARLRVVEPVVPPRAPVGSDARVEEAKAFAGRPGSFSVTLKQGTKSGKLFGVHPNMSILQVKVLIADSVGISVESQKLLFSGKVLTDKMTVRSAKLQAGSKIVLMTSEMPTPSASSSCLPS